MSICLTGCHADRLSVCLQRWAYVLFKRAHTANADERSVLKAALDSATGRCVCVNCVRQSNVL